MKDGTKLNGNEPHAIRPGNPELSGAPACKPGEGVAQDREAGLSRAAEKVEAHVDAELDKSIELSFPASDPIAAPPLPDASDLTPAHDPFEDLLDEAIALTFPASDPIAVSMYAELVAAAPHGSDAQARKP